MNRCQLKAQEIYDKNKQAVESGSIHNVMELSRIAKEQDRLYIFIHSRADKRMRESSGYNNSATKTVFGAENRETPYGSRNR